MTDIAKEAPKPGKLDTSSDPEAHELLVEVFKHANMMRFAAAKHEPTERGKRLMRNDTDWNQRCIMALAEQVSYWQSEYEAVQQAGIKHDRCGDIRDLPGGARVTAAMWIIDQISSALMHRKLPFDIDELKKLVDAVLISNYQGYHGFNPSGVVSALERRVKDEAEPNTDLRNCIENLRKYLGSQNYDGSKKLVIRLDQLLNDGGGQSLMFICEPPVMVEVGSPLIHRQLKAYLGLPLSDVDGQEATPCGPGDFRVPESSPLRTAHQIIGAALANQNDGRGGYLTPIALLADVVEIDQLSPSQRIELCLACHERFAAFLMPQEGEDYVGWQERDWLMDMARIAVGDQPQNLPVTPEQAEDLLLLPSATNLHYQLARPYLIDLVERIADKQPLSPATKYAIHRVRCQVIAQPPMGSLPKVAARLTKLIDGDATCLVVPGEVWADQVHTDLSKMTQKQRDPWVPVFRQAFTANASKPSAKWNKQAKPLISAVKAKRFRELLAVWFDKVKRGRSLKRFGMYSGDPRGGADTFIEGNADVLRGLVWMLASVPDANTPRLLADLLTTSIKRVPGIGPRAVKLANACIWALGETSSHKDEAVRIASLGQLARLKATVTFKTTLKMIDKALNKAAELTGINREDLEEMSVPTYGLTDVGKRTEPLGDFTAELEITGTTSTQLRWIKPDGKPQKSVPKAVKDNFADDLKELKAAAKDIEKMLPAQRDRLDKLHLAQKTWAYETWQERYLHHPITATLARRLIWSFDQGDKHGKADATWLDGSLVDAQGDAVKIDPASAIVSLWHPIDHDEAEVMAWRSFFEERRIKQPFKQAHREVYLLTDAERNTGVYSNRYAAHLIKQHQFNALCGVRGWNNRLRLMVDDEYPPASLALPAWNLRAEFWVEGAGDEYGDDTTDSGTYLYLATDQVRFYPLASAQVSAHAGGGGYVWSQWRGEDEPDPVPLEQIPPLVLSEVMRDVDLFVGVASVGNDPAWEDGGRENRYGHDGYWQSYSFGDLSGTATTRKQILERLIPRLKIADRCSFSEKFLVVKGDVRTYKIHLGSGNILMEPNDQYLCIVPGRGDVKGEAGKVFLPFEGDRTLSIILSKAFMLADDTKITDQTILSQIGRQDMVNLDS